MLQSFVFAQKRHLERTLARCKRPAYQSTHHYGQRPTSQLAPLNMGTVVTYPPSKASQAVADSTTLSIPNREFAPLMDALSTNATFEEILRSVNDSPSLSSLFSDRKKTRDLVVELSQSVGAQRSLQVLELAHQFGHTLKHGAYEAAAFHLASTQRWDMVLAVVSAAIQQTGSPTIRLLNWRARALVEVQQYSLLRKVLDEFRAANLSPPQRTYHLLLSGYMRNHDMEGAKECIRRMNDAGFPLDDYTHAVIGRFYRHFGVDLQVRQKALDSLCTLSPASAVALLNNLIRSAVDMKDIPGTLELLTLFDPSSVQGVMSSLSATYDLKMVLSRQPLFCLPTLPAKSLQPDAFTFAIFINHHIRCSNYQRAIDLSADMFSKGILATPSIATSLVHAYFLQGRGNTAIKMVAEMCNRPTPKEFTALMTHGGHTDDSTIPIVTNVQISTRICNALLRGVLRRQGLRHIPAIFAIMHANNIQPNARTLEVLLSHLSSTQGVRPRAILQFTQQLAGSSSEFTLRQMHHIIGHILREEKRIFLGSGWKAYSKKYLRPTYQRRSRTRSLSSVNMFDPAGGIGFGSHTGYSRIGEPFAKSLSARDVKSDSAIISQRIRRDAVLHGDFESAQNVLHTLSARGIHPNHYHLAALMEGYAMKGDLSGATEIMTLARTIRVEPNVVMYTILIHGYGRQHDTAAAMSTFQQMISKGVYPDIASIDALVGAFWAAGAHKLARRNLIMLWSYIEPFPDALQEANLATLIAHFRSLEDSRSRNKRMTKARPSIYHQVRRMVSSYRQYFGPLRQRQ